MGEIYCLYSPHDGVPRYVGQTEHHSRGRWNCHMTKALQREPGALYDWFRSLFADGADPEYHVLQEGIIPGDLDFYERYWIAQFDSLLNQRGRSEPSALTTTVGHSVIRVIRAKLVPEAIEPDPG